MISLKELEDLCTDRLKDANILYNAGQYDGAFYICGYAVEIGLKRKICMTLGWLGYPNSKKEFENLNSFKTHDLEVLLHLSGVENLMKSKFFSVWSIVISWDPEVRYSSRKQTAQNANAMLIASETLLKNL